MKPIILLLAMLVALPVPAGAAPKRDQAAAGDAPKPMAPIAITHRFANAPAVGQPLDLTLSIQAQGDLTSVNLSLAADDPLAMIDPVDTIGLGALAAGEASDVTVTVLPLIDQTHYLSVTVTAMIDGIAQSRSVAVPIRLPRSGGQKTDDDGIGTSQESVRSFEAIETVR